MFTNHPKGSHSILLATISCPLSIFSDSQSEQYFIALANAISANLKLTPIRTETCKYPPRNNDIGGLTVVTFLAESHIVIETYPEDELYEISIISCKRKIQREFVDALRACEISYLDMQEVRAIQKQGRRWRVHGDFVRKKKQVPANKA